STSGCVAGAHQRAQPVARIRRRGRKAQRRRLAQSVHFAPTAGMPEQLFLPRRYTNDVANHVVPGAGDVFVRHLWIEAVLFVEVDCRASPIDWSGSTNATSFWMSPAWICPSPRT